MFFLRVFYLLLFLPLAGFCLFAPVMVIDFLKLGEIGFLVFTVEEIISFGWIVLIWSALTVPFFWFDVNMLDSVFSALVVIAMLFARLRSGLGPAAHCNRKREWPASGKSQAALKVSSRNSVVRSFQIWHAWLMACSLGIYPGS